MEKFVKIIEIFVAHLWTIETKNKYRYVQKWRSKLTKKFFGQKNGDTLVDRMITI